MTELSKQDTEVLDRIARQYWKRAELNETYKDWKEFSETYYKFSKMDVERAVCLARQAETKRCLKEIEAMAQFSPWAIIALNNLKKRLENSEAKE